VPEVAQDPHAAALDLGGLRILVLVDHVLVGRGRHERGCVRRHPRGHEGREVEARAAVEQQLVGDQIVCHLAAHADLGQAVVRQPAGELVTDQA
jgi:hypothetical protein